METGEFSFESARKKEEEQNENGSQSSNMDVVNQILSSQINITSCKLNDITIRFRTRIES